MHYSCPRKSRWERHIHSLRALPFITDIKSKCMLAVGCWLLVAWLSSKYKLMTVVSMLSIDQATKRHRHSKFTKSDDINRMNIFGGTRCYRVLYFFFNLHRLKLALSTFVSKSALKDRNVQLWQWKQQLRAAFDVMIFDTSRYKYIWIWSTLMRVHDEEEKRIAEKCGKNRQNKRNHITCYRITYNAIWYCCWFLAKVFHSI